jgi:hypothetical protein
MFSTYLEFRTMSKVHKPRDSEDPLSCSSHSCVQRGCDVTPAEAEALAIEVNTITDILDIIHRPVTFRRLDSVSVPRNDPIQLGQIDRASLYRLTPETT